MSTLICANYDHTRFGNDPSSLGEEDSESAEVGYKEHSVVKIDIFNANLLPIC